MPSARLYSLLLAIYLITLVVVPTRSHVIHSGEEQLDGEDYILRWNVTSDEIHFEVVVRTLGYVGLGISPDGGMTGADIFIAGVSEDGNAYSSDHHATGPGYPIEDQHSDWILDAAFETESHTTLRFHRLLNTCDEEEDNPITEDTTRVIWAVGNTDAIEFHVKRGTKSINFFLDDDTDFDPTNFETWDILTDSEMPSQHTSYLCTFHAAPTLSEQRHIVAFEPVLDSQLALEHTRKFSLYRCVAPVGTTPDEVFGPYVGMQGRHCYDNYDPSEFPLAYCIRNFVYVWSQGGKRMVFPPDVGYPMSANGREYYVLEVHYDNPQELAGIQFHTGGRIYYTKQGELREKEASMLVLAHTTGPQLTIPPASQNFVVAAHCGGACTNAYLPYEGVTIFNNLFHSHFSGRKMKLRHFRGEHELPWIDVDNQYDFNYQQNKPLSKTVKILKGDQLTVECTYDNYWNRDNAAIGGLSVREEMCQAILYVYPRTSLRLCDSSQYLGTHFTFLGIIGASKRNSSMAGGLPEYNIIFPENLAGDYLDSVSYKVDWTSAFRTAYQEEKRFGTQEESCCVEGSNGLECSGGSVKYPDNLVEYAPINECEGVTRTTTDVPGTTTQLPCECENLRNEVDTLRSQVDRLRSEVDSLRSDFDSKWQ